LVMVVVVVVSWQSRVTMCNVLVKSGGCALHCAQPLRDGI
jgi:hypothetical protein